MPVLGCGAEMSKLMDVANDDIAIIEDTIAERLAMGVSQALAQRQAVDEALAQLADERSAVMRAIDEQLGREEATEPVFAQKAYHGTPHRGIEKFSTDKIGTGEGAQAYGWGLYFASKREIAEHYRKVLTAKRGSRLVDATGNHYMPKGTGMDALVSVYLATNGGDYAATSEDLKKTYEDMPDVLTDALAELQRMQGVGIKIDPETQGQLYEVDIPEDNEMLAWDKPLSEQPEGVQPLIDKILNDPRRRQAGFSPDRVNAFGEEMTGADLYHAASATWFYGPGGAKGASQFFSDNGVKGIKYPAEQLSGAKEVRSHNYVVFDGAATEIVDTHYANKADAGAGFRSVLREAVDAVNMKAAPAAGWKDAIKGLVNKGAVKADEVEWSGVNEWLDLQQGKVTRDQVAQFLGENGVQVDEVVLGGENQANTAFQKFRQQMRAKYPQWEERRDLVGLLTPEEKVRYYQLADARRDAPDRQTESKYQQWTLPGGENYREVLLTLPAKGMDAYGTLREEYNRRYGHYPEQGYWPDGLNLQTLSENLGTDPASDSGKVYRSRHWDQPNVLAHIRVNDRTDADGKRVLFVEEIQSDWGQEGKKKGFKGEQVPAYQVQWNGRPVMTYETRQEAEDHVARANAAAPGQPISIAEVFAGLQGADPRELQKVPKAPFVGKTDAWVALALKRIIKMAADEGYDRVAFVNGEQSAKRYDLSQQIEAIDWIRRKDGTYDIAAFPKNGGQAINKDRLSMGEVADMIGKELADRIAKEKGDPLPLDWADATGTLKGLDLKVGGEGMRAFYDKIVPSVLKDVLRKVGGGKLGTVKFGSADKQAGWRYEENEDGLYDIYGPDGFVDTVVNEQAARIALDDYSAGNSISIVDQRGDSKAPVQQPGFDITDAMREKAAEGLPLFSNKAQTETPEFKRWFGDSKVVDENGRPLVVYHGTASFEGGVFKKAMSFFTTKPSFANGFAELRSRGKGGVVLPVYLSIQRPFNGRNYSTDEQVMSVVDDYVNELRQQGESEEYINGMKAEVMKGQWRGIEDIDALLDLASYGFDGLEVIEAGVLNYATFRPNQIKSATDNNGRFDPANPDIRFANKAQTETPEFDRWFGDSKVVDADGKPLVVYHGTNADIIEFDPTKQDPRDAGFWFANAPVYANQYAAGRNGGNVMPVYLSLKNPKIYYDRTTAITPELVAKLQAQGFDGIVRDFAGGPEAWRYAEGQREYAVFQPTQIKSAIGNRGTFDPANPDIRFANRAKRNDTGVLFDRDVTGRLKLALPRQVATSLPGKVVSNVLDRLYLKSPDQNVRHTLRQMKIDVQKSIETAGEIADQVNKLSTDEREMVSDIIEGELKAGVVPPKHIVQLAAQMNQAFRNQTAELVRLGMLTQEAADRWRDKYLPRYYASKLKKTVGETWADLAGNLSQTRRFNQGIKGRSLKGRGMVNTIPVSELTAWEAKGWEVRDASYDPATSQEVHIWRDFTKQEREDMDEIRDAGFRFVMGYMETQKDLALGHMYERIANDPEMSSHAEKQGYVRVPDTTVSGTGALRYGKLAGRWVPRNLMSQLSTGYELESEAFQTYKKALAWWKSNKTVMNPVSHLNNFMSNATMAHFAGVSYWDVHKYAAAVKDLATGAAQVKEARDAGLFLGSLTDAELQKILPPELRALLGKVDSTGVKALKMVDKILTFGLRNTMSQAYEFGDRYYKYLIYSDARANGATPEEAVDHAIRYIFTYDEMPRTARQIRDLGIPFFSYTFKAIPALVHTAAARPDRLFALAGLISLMGAMSYAMLAAGADDDWMDAIRKYATDAEFRAKANALKAEEYEKLPDWMQGHSALGTLKQIRLWNDKASGLPVFLDVSRFVPGGDLFDVTGNAGGIPWAQPLTPNNPLLNLFAAFFLNKDPYFGRDLVNKDTDTGWEAAGKRAEYLWKMATPGVAVANTMWDKLVGVAANLRGDEIPYLPDAIGGGNTGVGKDGLAITPKYAIPQIIGVKARPVDLEMSDKIDRSDKRRTLKQLNDQLRQARLQNSAGYLSDRLLERRSEALRQKMGNVRQGLTVSGDERD